MALKIIFHEPTPAELKAIENSWLEHFKKQEKKEPFSKWFWKHFPDYLIDKIHVEINSHGNGDSIINITPIKKADN